MQENSCRAWQESEDETEVEVFEHQRWNPIYGWGSRWPGNLLPGDVAKWTSRDYTKYAMRRPNFEAGPGYEWISEWTVDLHKDCGEEGWTYGIDFQSIIQWPPKPEGKTKRAMSMVRRRRWIRLRVRKDDAVLHTDADLAKENEDRERRWLRAQAAEPDLPTNHDKPSRISHEQVFPSGCYVRSENNEEMAPDGQAQRNVADGRFHGASTIQIRISDAYKLKSSPTNCTVEPFNSDTSPPSETPMPANVYETSFEERILETEQLSREAEVKDPKKIDPQSKKSKLQALSIVDLKRRLAELEIKHDDCIEKSDLVDKLLHAPDSSLYSNTSKIEIENLPEPFGPAKFALTAGYDPEIAVMAFCIFAHYRVHDDSFPGIKPSRVLTEAHLEDLDHKVKTLQNMGFTGIGNVELIGALIRGNLELDRTAEELRNVMKLDR